MPIRNPVKAQSAIEYLMTYGWAIVVIAIVLGVLYYLGIFGGTASVAQASCLATAGYSCSGLTLNTTGNVLVTLGQLGSSPITVSAIACTNSSAAPSSSVAVASTVIPSSGQTTFTFQCPGAGGIIGTAYSGYLWLTYSSSTQANILTQVARFSSKVTTSATFGGGAASVSFGGSNGITQSSGSSQLAVTATGTYSVYICAQGNWPPQTETTSFSSDANEDSGYSSVGHQTSSSTCTVSNEYEDSLGIIGFSGYASYAVTNTLGEESGSTVTISYNTANGNTIAIAFACGNQPCGSFTPPSGCTNYVALGMNTANSVGSADIAVCSAQPTGSYTVSIPCNRGNCYYSAAIYSFAP